ncbi:MAG: hypothetical protein HYW07_07975 [Candidatus Latescibacteria bacterium]|nr:hypothetical protein [Candidatus Latescibacterota bacterium]
MAVHKSLGGKVKQSLVALLAVLLCLPVSAQQAKRSPNSGLSIITAPASQPLRSFLNREVWPGYWNYGGQPYLPTTVSVRSEELYDRLGTHLLRGYPLVSWRETRSDSLGLQESRLVRENFLFEFFSELVIANDSYKGWNFAVLAGDNIRTALTPLTLRTPRWQGVRIDAEAERQGFTLLLTRGALGRFSAFDARRDLSPVLAYGGRYHRQLSEVLTLGATLYNQHQVDVESKQGSFINGTQPYQMQAPTQIFVRVESDAPELGAAAGVYQMDLELEVAGEDGARTRMDVQAEPPRGGRRAGDLLQVSGPGEAVDFTFNLPPQGQVLSALFRAEVAGDYRISVRQVHDFTFTANDQRRTEQRSWPAPPSHTQGGPLYPIDFKPGETQPHFTVARAEGSPGLGRRRTVKFDYAIPSGKTLIGTDFRIDAKELLAQGEVVYNIEEGHFPFAEDSLQVKGKKTHRGSWAYTLNLRRPLKLHGLRAELGGELFHMDPEYSGGYDSRRGGTVFFTDRGGPSGTEAFSQEFSLVEDNDDDDRYPDDTFEDGGRYAAEIPGSFGATPWAGVFPGLDVDGDQAPDNDQDRNGLADWNEPFLHYGSDPSDFVYGIDFNNNAQPDFRENDDYPDYPIRKDQRGFHSFAGLDRPVHWLDRVVLGYYDLRQIAGAGKAQALYVRGKARWHPGKGVRIELDDDAKLVEDSIRDEVYAWVTGDTALFGANTNTPFNPPPADPLVMRKSAVNTAFLQLVGQPLADLELRADLLHFLNHQRRMEEGGAAIQESGSFAEFSLTTRGEYHHSWGNLDLWTGGKYAFKEGRRGPAWPDQSIRFFGPIFKVSYEIIEDMSFQWGTSGFPALPMRLVNNEDESMSYKERKMVFMLNGRTDDYQGYVVDLSTGLELHRRNYDQGGQERDYDAFGIFLDVIIGN